MKDGFLEEQKIIGSEIYSKQQLINTEDIFSLYINDTPSHCLKTVCRVDEDGRLQLAWDRSRQEEKEGDQRRRD